MHNPESLSSQEPHNKLIPAGLPVASFNEHGAPHSSVYGPQYKWRLPASDGI